jgi:NAD(P)H-dependent FMN reductase
MVKLATGGKDKLKIGGSPGSGFATLGNAGGRAMGTDILIINGSPRPDGNSARLSALCAEEFDRLGASWEEIDLRRLTIGACQGCNACADKKAKYCSQKDDMVPLYEKVAQCRAILFVTPVYWMNVTAQTKTFIDRLYGLYNWQREFLAGKAAGAVLVYADADLYQSGGINAVSAFEHLFRFTGARGQGFAYGSAYAPGDAEANPDLLERTRGLARRMVEAG